MSYIVSNAAKEALSALLADEKAARAVAFAAEDQLRCLEEHIRLTEIEAPTYHEQARAEAFAELLREEGLENVHIGKGGNVIGTLKGSVSGKAVLVDAHLDTVFPFGSVTKVRQENGILYAPGICDDTRALAMMLSAIRALKAADITTRRDVIFLGSTREEGSGSMGGMVDFLSEHQDEIECCISVDSSALQNIIYCATGLRTVEFTFRGIGGHAYSAFGDVAQPVHAAARVAAAIADLQVPSDPKTTFAVSNFHAGNKASMHAIPAECSIIVNYRSNDPATLEWLHEQIFAIVEKACADETARWGKDVITWSHEVHCDVPAGSQDAHAPLVENLAAIIEHMGCRTTLMPGGATNCNITIARGIPSVCMGMTWSPDSTHVPTLDHTLAEWFPVEGAYKAVQALVLMILLQAGMREAAMNQIRFAANPDTNFVFHMLSVARVGYDNAYGERFRSDYPAEDLGVLKEYEELLTVRGGEHCGELYYMMVILPACAEQSAKEYYTALLDEAINGPVPPEAEVYRPIVADICRVMIRHYDDYIARIWPGQEADICRYIPQVEEKFASSDFTARAVQLVGCGLPGEAFTATMVTSVENGAEAIDISREQDVFGIVRDPVDAFYFIGHEFIIYLLKNALKDEDAFQSFATWPVTEGLAEYYLKRLLGDTRFFNAQRKIVAFLEQLPDAENLPAPVLYRFACGEFVI